MHFCKFAISKRYMIPSPIQKKHSFDDIIKISYCKSFRTCTSFWFLPITRSLEKEAIHYQTLSKPRGIGWSLIAQSSVL